MRRLRVATVSLAASMPSPSPRWIDRVPLLRGLRAGSLRLNVAWTLLGNTVQLGSQWASLMVLARLGSETTVGTYSFALGLCAPVIGTGSLGLRNVLVTDARRESEYAHYLALRVVTTALGMLVIAAASLALAPSRAALAAYVLVAAARSIDVLSDIHWAQLQRAERMDLIAISQAARGILGIAFLVIGMALGRSLVWGAAGLFAASLAVWAFFDLVAVRKVSPDEPVWPKFDWDPLAKIFRTVAPLAGSLLLTTVAGPMPRYFLKMFWGEREVGLFAVASSPLALVGFLPVAIFQATTARAAHHYLHGERRQFIALAWRVMALNLVTSGGFCLASVLFGRYFLMLYKPQYMRLWPEMNIFCFAQFLMSFATIGVLVMSAGRMFRLQALNSVVSVFVLVLANFALVPSGGVRATAWADVIYKSLSTLAIASVGVWYLLRKRHEPHETT
jgi:O-antigen/teichoic acid export membrane protein